MEWAVFARGLDLLDSRSAERATMRTWRCRAGCGRPVTMPRTDRSRKTKDPCPRCFMHRDHCLCAEIPRLDLKTRLCLVVHAKELKRTTNTGRLAVEALVNSEMRVRGESEAALDLSDSLSRGYRTLLFYPSEDARELTAELVAEDPRPIQLIVPDGNWRQASKVATRQPELAQVPRVSVRALPSRQHFLRAESKPEGMATLEAVARAFEILEGAEVGRALMALYELKLEKTLRARGISL